VAKYRLDLKTNPTVANPPRHYDELRRIQAARKIKSYLKVLLSVPFVVAVLYFGSVLYNSERVVPKGVETVQDFYQRYGNPPRVESLLTAGQRYYRIIGEIPAPLGFPKSAPIYIFDNTGRLIEWTGGLQMDPDFTNRWKSASAERMTVSDFLDKFPPN
jgi:hypothetical protein